MCTENHLRNKLNSVKGRITLILHSDLSCTGQGKKIMVFKVKQIKFYFHTVSKWKSMFSDM